MKKIFAFITALCSIIVVATSCLDDSNAEATCTYAVFSDSITYTDTLDVQYDSLIHVSLSSLGHAQYSFTKTAKVEQSMTAFAVAKCNDLAAEQFTANLKKTLTISEIQNEMYKANSDVFTAHGITNAAAIGLHPFIVHLTLWNYTDGTAMGTGDLNVNH